MFNQKRTSEILKTVVGLSINEGKLNMRLK
jgi:hypothetical protein